ncbi:glycoside hydrolase family 130 protein [Psychromonas ossibalaenae]|uniref:glycoside hydrolase family 130 protein n=1 Tax=Psychromonas ossibalaenae TaxID=444922 RepID=UPI00037D53DD|nr:glycoside hydrolase family 130 protein [Psychromonas ossibalaenae]
MKITRYINNPIISPKDVKPSQPGFKVDCVFNAGVIKTDTEVILLLRIAESIISDSNEQIKVPLLIEDNGQWLPQIKIFDLNDPLYCFDDPREIKLVADPSVVFLTSMSHLRIARSSDGINFDISDSAFIAPDNKYEQFGCEDARITQIDDLYYINYSAVSPFGITTALASTTDFNSVTKHGILFSPDNRDVCLFPEKIDGKYMALHRPAPKHFGKPEIWITESPDMVHWGAHQHLLGSSEDDWDSLKLGGGAPMIKTAKGWLQIYHGVDAQQRYCLGALLLDLENPTKILAKSATPLLEPQAPYELEGFFGNVVFTCGAYIDENILNIYYGAADEHMALAQISVDELWNHLQLN